jgi:hypothetical protein
MGAGHAHVHGTRLGRHRPLRYLSALGAGMTGSKSGGDMGLLDDLEQESQRRKASLGGAEQLKLEREQAFKTRLEPGLQAFHEYLAKLTANLSFLKPKTQLRYDIPGYGTVVANVEHEYDLRANTISPVSKEVVLLFSANVATDDCPTVQVQGAPKIRTLNSFFQKARLAGIAESKKDEAGDVVQATFRARGKVTLNVTVAADAEGGVARLSFTNFDALGTVTKTASPQQFDEKLFDEVGRFIARETNTLFRETLPEDFRKQLAQKVQQEQLKRKWESKIAEQQNQDLDRAKKEQGLKGRIDRAVKDVTDKAPSILDKVKGLFNKKP